MLSLEFSYSLLGLYYYDGNRIALEILKGQYLYFCGHRRQGLLRLCSRAASMSRISTEGSSLIVIIKQATSDTTKQTGEEVCPIGACEVISKSYLPQ